MTNLSKALKKTYAAYGNRFVFGEKYSLGELANEMYERLGYQQIDPSVLSKVINGKRLFSHKQLICFCAILELSEELYCELNEALRADLLAKKGFSHQETSTYNSYDVHELVSMQVEQLVSARERGYLEYVDQCSDNLLEVIPKYINRTHSIEAKNALLDLLSMVCYEKAYVSGCIFKPNEILNHTLPLISRQKEIATMTGKIEGIIRAEILYSFGLYASTNYKKDRNAIDRYKESMTTAYNTLALKPQDQTSLLILWRLIAVNSSYLNLREVFYQAESEIINVINMIDNPSTVSYIIWCLDAIARGKSFFRDESAFDDIEKARKYNEMIKWNDPLRDASRLRNEVEVLINLSLETDSQVKLLAQKGLELASRNSFGTYQLFFNNLM